MNKKFVYSELYIIGGEVNMKLDEYKGVLKYDNSI